MKRLLIVLAAVVGSVLVVAPAEAAPANCATTPVIAHRGLTTNAVENTTRAVQHATHAGLQMEVDLRTTRDDKIVLMHDANIRRTTTGVGLVAEMTGSQIRRHRTNDGQVVPYLASILRLIRDNPGAGIYLHLKALNAVTERRVSSLIADYGIADQVTAISFEGPALVRFRAASPGAATNLIESGPPSVERAVLHGGANVSPKYLTPEYTAQMKARGLPYNARSNPTNNPTTWELALHHEVTNLMIDDVAAYRDWCAGST